LASVIEILSCPPAALDVVQEIVQSLDEILPARSHRFAKHFGIGEREVRRRERVDVLAREEVDLLLGLVVQAFHARHLVVHPAAVMR
jgi:hypothetical protein